VSTTLTLRLTEAEKEVLSNYAKDFGMSLSEFVRTAVLEKLRIN